jgi:uncharacterized membrane protein HdeD (DUF308 family)
MPYPANSPCNADASSNLVLLPDLSTTAQRWNKIWLLMLSWLLTNILSVLLVVPLAASHQWSLVTDAAMISAAFGAAGIVQYLMRPRGQPEDGEYCTTFRVCCQAALFRGT